MLSVGPFYVIVEYCEHGSLLQYLRNSRLEENGYINHRCRRYFRSQSESGNSTEPELLNIRDLLSFAWQISKGMQYLSEIKVTNKAEHFLQLISLDDDQRKAMHYESWYPIIRIDLKEKNWAQSTLGSQSWKGVINTSKTWNKDLFCIWWCYTFSLSACTSRSGCKKRFGWYRQSSEDIRFRSYQRRIRSRHISQKE